MRGWPAAIVYYLGDTGSFPNITLNGENGADDVEIRRPGDDAGEVAVVEDEGVTVVGVFVDLGDLLFVDDIGLLDADEIG